MQQLIEQYMNQEKMFRMEGRRGVENLCKLSTVIGYKDPMHFGQFSNGSSIGDLIALLEDNPGAIEAVVNWMGEQTVDEWEDSLRSHLAHQDDDEDL